MFDNNSITQTGGCQGAVCKEEGNPNQEGSGGAEADILLRNRVYLL